MSLYRKKIDRLTPEDAAKLYNKVTEYAKGSEDYIIIQEHLSAYIFMKTQGAVNKIIRDAATATQDTAARTAAAWHADQARVSQLTPHNQPDTFAPIQLGGDNPSWFKGEF